MPSTRRSYRSDQWSRRVSERRTLPARADIPEQSESGERRRDTVVDPLAGDDASLQVSASRRSTTLDGSHRRR
ncbi:hypothetical protein C5O27_17365 [Gordonia alkanivorans]|nr:hypothetical protein C5O27_17365 [Gordonia alkanivorans]